MRVLVSNVYSYKNKGDAAIVISLLREIERVFGKTDIMVQTTDIQHDAGKYGPPVTSSLMWLLLSSVRDSSIPVRLWVPLRGLSALLVFLWSARWLKLRPYFLLTTELKEFVHQNERADFVIACGGGYLRMPNSSPRETILLFVTCLNILGGKYLGKNVYLYSQSIGPVHSRIQKAILRFTLNRVDLIEPRETVSLKFLLQLRPKTDVIMTADPALLLGGTGTPPKKIKLAKGRLHVGLTVRKWFKDSADLAAYMQAVADTIDYLIESHNAQVVYVPQVVAENFGDDDRLVAEQVKELVKNKDNFLVVKDDLHPFEVIGLCGQMDIFIGTRMHSNIFSLISYVPVVAIEYEHKTRGIMRGLGLENLVIDIKAVTAKLLIAKVDELLKHRAKYVKAIKTNLPKQVKQSRKAMEAIKEHYEQSR